MSAQSPLDEGYLLSVRSRAAASAARRIIKSAQLLPTSGVLVSVDFVGSLGRRNQDDSDHEQCISHLIQVAQNIRPLLTETNNENGNNLDLKKYRDRHWLFAIARGPPHRDNDAWPIILTSSNEDILKKAIVRMNARFLGRIEHRNTDTINSEDEMFRATTWLARVKETGTSENDRSLLCKVVQNVSHTDINDDSSLPPLGARNVGQLISFSQERLKRLSAKEAFDELQTHNTNIEDTNGQSLSRHLSLSSSSPIILVDIRTPIERAIHGTIPLPNVVHINRLYLEIILDPQSPSPKRLPTVDEYKYNLRVIMFDQDGTGPSSLAAASLHDLGLLQSTDIIGGFDAWKKAGLPIASDPHYS